MANDEPLGAMTSPHYLYSSVNPHAILTDRSKIPAATRNKLKLILDKYLKAKKA